jgi:hypothetical protein
MLLEEIQNHIQQKGCASLAQLEMHFDIEAHALEGMLAHLIRKGRIQQLPTPERCHGCTSCSTASLQFYESCQKSRLLVKPQQLHSHSCCLNSDNESIPTL